MLFAVALHFENQATVPQNPLQFEVKELKISFKTTP